MDSVSKDETLHVNVRQKEFYNKPGERKNKATKAWSYIRNRLLSDIRDQTGIKKRVYEQHVEWLGDLKNSKVLDLGCLRGNALSIYMAQHAKSYVGIDLSDVAIEKLNRKLVKNNCVNAKAVAVDFYSDEFKEREFDIIYAYGVIHHFPNLDMLFARINEVLKPGGKLITYDPLQTSLPVKILRQLYRPFQSDKDWEWPFDKAALNKIKNQYKLLGMHGILGKSKWAIILNYIPFPGKGKTIRKLVEDDWSINSIDRKLYSCMQVTFHLQKNS